MENASIIADFLDWIGLTGILAMVAGAIGYGRLAQKIENQDKHLKALQEESNEGRRFAGQNAVTLARMEERLDALRGDMLDLKGIGPTLNNIHEQLREMRRQVSDQTTAP